MLTDGTYNDPTQPASHLVPSPLLSPLHSPFRSFSLPSYPCSFIRPVSLPQPLSRSPSFSPFRMFSWLYLSCIHPLCSPTDCQNHPSDETQTVLPNVCATRSLAICISFVPRHRIFRERVLSGGFSVLLSSGRDRRQPCLRSKPATSIFVASVSRVFDRVLIFNDDILIFNKSVSRVYFIADFLRSLKSSSIMKQNIRAMRTGI